MSKTNVRSSEKEFNKRLSVSAIIGSAAKVKCLILITVRKKKHHSAGQADKFSVSAKGGPPYELQLFTKSNGISLS